MDLTSLQNALKSVFGTTITSSTFKGVVTSACRLTVPRGAKEKYQKDKSWKKFSLISEQN